MNRRMLTVGMVFGLALGTGVSLAGEQGEKQEGAAAELLRYSFSPTPDADDADQATEAAGRLAGRISVIRTGVAGAGRFAWQRGRTGTALDAIGI